MKEEDMKIKKIIIGVLCAVVCIMVVGFAAFSTNLNISGTSSIESNWSVVFTNIQELSKTDGITINNQPAASGTTATFDVSLKSPGDSIEYQITVENNYVSFAGFYWRIIRINEDGSVRLIYQGATPDATGNATTIGSSTFNSNYNDNAYAGYMYGETGSSTYSATHANTNDSTIKTVIDTWYEEKLLEDYASYLADTGFCGDRSIASEPNLWGSSDTALGYGRNTTYYGSFNRLYTNKTPQFSCPQENDLYTTSSSTKGNKALDYPIGLISADEVAYAGGVHSQLNTSYYLCTRGFYRIMSPLHFDGSMAVGWGVGPVGRLEIGSVHVSLDVRPVINLVSGIEITGGDGTSSNPYIIKTS